MKKIISLILAFTILAMMANIGLVSAAIPAGNGKGVALEFKQIRATSPASGTYYSTSVLEDTGFDSAYNYTYKGGNNKAIVQFALDFTNNQTITSGDKVYVSFYYRFNDTDTHNLPTYVQRRNYTNSSTGKTTIGSVSTDWQKASFITTSGANVASGTDVAQFFLIGITDDAPASMDIAEPTCVYYGAVTGDDADAQIQAELDKSQFTSISVGETAIDLTANPDSYTTTESISAADITAVGYNSDVDITSAETADGTVYTLKSYALSYDKTDKTDTKYSTYTITSGKAPSAIPVNNGKGATLAFKEIKRNSPSGGTGAPISTIEDSKFGTVTRYEYIEATKNIVQLSLTFTNTYDISVGDTFNLSYYYRFTDDETYNVPNSMQHRDINTNSNKTTFASGFTAGEWRKASLTLTATTALAAGSDVYLRHLIGLTTGDKFCMDIAYPTCIYFGNVASENASEVDAQLNKSDFTSISIGNTAIDLAANPTSYTTTEVVSKSDITAVGYYDSAVVKIDSEETDDAVVYTITSYAIGHDLTSTTDTKYTTYTITAVKPAPSITLNGGKGQALEFAEFVGVSPSNPENYSVSELDGTDFEKAYRYEYFGNADLGIIQNIARFKPGTEIPAGEYFYFSYYYRFVKDDTHALPTGIARRGSVNNSSEKPGIETGVKEEWTKAEFIVTNYNAISADAFAETRFLLTLANKTDKIYMDIAEPTCVYFGAATGDVEEAINEQISKSDISAITINGAPVDLAANPTSYTTTEKAEFDNIAVTGYHNPSIIKKSVSKADGNVTYTITAYAVDYDFLDSTDTRKSTYTLTVAAPDYDVYSYDYAKTATGYTVNAMFDNATNEAANFDYIVAAYNGDVLVGTGIASYSNITGNGNKLSADIVTESGISYVKIFLWNSKTGLMPVINSRVID